MLHITLFGGTGTRGDGHASPPSGRLGTKPRQLFEILALRAGQTLSKEMLADLLWEGRPPTAYVAGLESYISVLRRQSGLGAGRTSILATADNGYTLDTARCTVDLLELRALADGVARSSFAEVVHSSERALELCSGGLLPHEPYARWAVDAREEVGGLLSMLLTRGAQSALALGLPERAVPLAEAAIRHDPRHEEAWQHLMRAQWFCGDTNQALRTYLRLRSMLVDEMGQEPADETAGLYLAVLAHSTRRGADEHHHSELRLLLTLLRQALDGVPGLRTPALDDDLSSAAMRLLADR
ncbi:MAG: winged helix-turn-helix domain-containing protein [Actinomycetota bacterium]|nr:winged helix-turn-helix domain-containing protein [Actinomycetota bacterium]